MGRNILTPKYIRAAISRPQDAQPVDWATHCASCSSEPPRSCAMQHWCQVPSGQKVHSKSGWPKSIVRRVVGRDRVHGLDGASREDVALFVDGSGITECRACVGVHQGERVVGRDP